jgi:hypothetical protein
MTFGTLCIMNKNRMLLLVRAFLIGGETLHELLCLPVKGQVQPLLADRQAIMQLKFKHVRLLVIDEKSMIGQKQLFYVNKRLQEGDPTKAMNHLVACLLYSWGIGNSCLQFWTAHTTRIFLNCKEERMQLGKKNERKMLSLLNISSRHRPICSTANLTRVSSLQRSNDRKEVIRQNFVQNSSVLEW